MKKVLMCLVASVILVCSLGVNSSVCYGAVLNSSEFICSPSEQLVCEYPSDIISTYDYYVMLGSDEGKFVLMCSNYPFICADNNEVNSISIRCDVRWEDVIYKGYVSTDGVAWTLTHDFSSNSKVGYKLYSDGSGYKIYSANHNIYDLFGELLYGLDGAVNKPFGANFYETNSSVFEPHAPSVSYSCPDYSEELYPYYLVVNAYNGSYSLYYIYSDKPIFAFWTYSTQYKQFVVSYDSFGDMYVYGSNDGVSWEYEGGNSLTAFWTVKESPFGISALDMHTEFVDSNHSIYTACGNLLYSSPLYSNDIGYLKDINLSLLYLSDEWGGRVEGSGLYRFTFGDVTTNGIDLREEDFFGAEYFIRVYGQCAIWDKNMENVCPNTPLAEIGDYPINGEPLYVSFTYDDFFNTVTDSARDVIDEIYTAFNMQTLGYMRRDNFYLQVCRKYDDGSIECGGLTKISCSAFNWATHEHVYSIETVDSNLEVDSSGYSDSGNVMESANGSSYDDAQDKIDNNLGVGDGVLGYDSLTDSLEELTKFMGDVPLVFGSVLSFLPTWLQSLIYGAFGITVVILVIKVFRG